MTPIIAGIMECTQRTLYDQAHWTEDRKGGASHVFFTDPWTNDREETLQGWRLSHLRTNGDGQPIGRYRQKFLVQRVCALFLYNGTPLLVGATDLYAKTEIEFRVDQKSYAKSIAILCPSPLALFGTPKEDLARIEDAYGLPWHKVPGSLLNKTEEGPAVVDGVLIETIQVFDVRATIHVDVLAGTTLAIHLDGPYLWPVI